MYQVQNRPDTAALLSRLIGILGELTGPVDQYLQRMYDQVVTNPFLDPAATAYVRISESMPDQALIHRLSSCQIVGFTDWALEQNGTGLWDGLYTGVIKPLKKRDFQFLFHMGDVTNKMVYDIDEALDIISDYSAYGKVTLMLDNEEAVNLWNKLNGAEPDSVEAAYGAPRTSEKYQFLFNTMKIDALVVQHGYSAIQLSRDSKFVLPGMPPAGKVTENTKIRFSSGYGMGMLLKLDPWHCLALGLVLSGADTETPTGLDTPRLIAYIQSWISIL